MRLRKALGAAGALLGGTIAALTLAPTAQADSVAGADAPPLRYLSYNICGNNCSDAKGYDNQRRIDTVVAEASGATWNADQIHLQEVCRTQFDALGSRLQAYGFQGHFATALPGGNPAVCGGADYGNAVFVKGSVAETKVLDLTVGGEAEPITVPCVKTYTQSRANWACSVHLYWNDATLREQEAAKLAAQAKSWQDAGLPVVLGGDFNTTPRSKTASYFYEPGINDGGLGTFVEADETDADNFVADPCSDGRTRCRSGEPSFNTSKIDYLFLSAAHFKGAKADVLPLDGLVSDHKALRGAAYWSDCGPSAAGAGAVFRRDAKGALFRYAGRANGTLAGACKVGTGWGGMKQVVRDGSAVVAVDATGTLWRYPADPATGTYSGSTRVQAGTGWTNDTLLAPGDFSGDGKSDLIGRDAAGVLWLYPGDGANGYGARKNIGTGWQSYDTLLAPGDFSGDGKSDLIGRDANGDLWLYKGDGAGSYSPRVKIGNGWQIYTALAAPGDLNGDGKADLTGREANGTLWYYAGDGATSYAPRTQVGNGYPDGELLF
ncbi:endonuclease/exonuclease/phosphatase family protein [Streptomyces sp. NPDC004267]|uniref:endonuclease/exonuclease/phosphatase family protein n=1 Tax=Streptomyces sp. NPDC004267 TaxID=3364694 RepID=UPI003691D78C